MSYELPLMVYVIGPTNAGKTTLMNMCVLDPRITTIEVGKMMRAKYPPEHFQGQNNPAHTAVEAWQMYLDGVQEGHNNPQCRMIVCDGQPRDSKQTEAVLADKAHFKLFLHLWAPDNVRAERAEKRDFGSPALLELSRARLVNDIPANYNVLVRLLNAQEKVWSVDTNHPDYSAQEMLKTLLAQSHNHRRMHC